MTTGTEPIPPSALQRLGKELAELLDDDHWNNIESNYLLPALEELEQAKRDALPCQVLDVLDSNRKLERSLGVQVNYATELEKENKAREARVAELEARITTASRAGHLAAAQEVIERVEAERDRYRAGLESTPCQNMPVRCKDIEHRAFWCPRCLALNPE